jgi:hypothetical protein
MTVCRKLLTSLAPLLAIAVLGIMPAAAAAEEGHWYKNGTILKEGSTIPFVTWGGSTNVAQSSELGETNCRTVGGGTLTNPAGGGHGEGKANEYEFYECKSAACEKAAGETGLPLGPHVQAGVAIPWKLIIEGAILVAGIVKELLHKNVVPAMAHAAMAEPGAINETISCETPPGFEPHVVGYAESLSGGIEAKIGPGHNGTSTSKPSVFAFFGSEGEQVWHGEGAKDGEVKMAWSGEEKYQGYNAQELLTVQVP